VTLTLPVLTPSNYLFVLLMHLKFAIVGLVALEEALFKGSLHHSRSIYQVESTYENRNKNNSLKQKRYKSK